MRKITFIKICTCNFKKIVLIKFWFMYYENIRFFLWYMDPIHIKYIDFSSILFFFFFLLFCNVSWWQHVLIALISVIFLPRLQYSIENTFLQQRKKKKNKKKKHIKLSLFLRQMLMHMIFCSENNWGTFNIKLSRKFFSSAAYLIMSHVSSCGLLLKKGCPYLC